MSKITNDLASRFESITLRLHKGQISQNVAQKETDFLIDIRDELDQLEDQIMTEERKAFLWRQLFIALIMDIGHMAKNDGVTFKPVFPEDLLAELMRLDKSNMRVIWRLWMIQAELNGYGQEYIQKFQSIANE